MAGVPSSLPHSVHCSVHGVAWINAENLQASSERCTCYKLLIASTRRCYCSQMLLGLALASERASPCSASNTSLSWAPGRTTGAADNIGYLSLSLFIQKNTDKAIQMSSSHGERAAWYVTQVAHLLTKLSTSKHTCSQILQQNLSLHAFSTSTTQAGS